MNRFNSAISLFLFDNPEPLLKVSSNSMYPLVTAGEKIRILPVKRPLTCGKCYIFNYKNKLTIHRLVSIGNGEALFSGDNAYCLTKVPEDAVIAEPIIRQTRLTITIIQWLNMLFSKKACRIRLYDTIRRKIVWSIISIERFIYERTL